MKLFLPQTTLEEWALSEKADLKDGKLVISQDQSSYPVTPAVHFRTVVSGPDEHKLAEKVKTQAQLAALGAEHMADSVILGESAYEVAEGYIAEVVIKTAPGQKPSSETDLLANFLLGKLS
ncbi:MAG: hypothetical protein ACOZIN_06410 [Myxococcota bacterium]